MNRMEIKRQLEEGLGIKKEIVALKRVKEDPPPGKLYGDKNHICYMIGEILEEGKTFYTVLDDHVCLLGCAATGLDPALSMMDSTDRAASDQYHVDTVNIFPSEDIQRTSEEEATRLFPQFMDVCKAILMGPLVDVPEPDIAVVLATPEQAHKLTRAYCYATGSFIKGYAGMGACRMLFPAAFLNGEPSFTISDRSWRKALNLTPTELTLVVPLDKLEIMLENLEESNRQWSS